MTMAQVGKVMTYFNKLQKKHGYTEYGNVLQQKWDMRDIIESIPTKDELEQLMKFFMLYSDDKSFQYFAWNYHNYYETMLRVKEDRLKRRYLQEETLARIRKDESE